MARSLLRIFISLSATFGWMAASFGNVNARSIVIRFETLTVEDGLSESSVWGIVQDGNGFIWIGTDEGLNQYDGYDFSYLVHDPGNPNSLSDNIITALYSDSRGDLWIGTLAGLDHYDIQTRKFKHYPFVESGSNGIHGSAVLAIEEDHAGNLWIGTRDGGLNLLLRSSGMIFHNFADPQSKSAVIPDQVMDLAIDLRGWVWAATPEGLFSYIPSSKNIVQYTFEAFNPHSLSDTNCLSVIADQNGSIWIGTAEGGLNQLDPESGRFTRFLHDPENPSSVISNQVTHLLEDQQGALWIGTPNGLDRLENGSLDLDHFSKDRNDPYSLSDDTITSLFEDRTGIVWVGTSGEGVNYYSPTANKFLRSEQNSGVIPNLSDDDIYGISETPDGALWIATKDWGLNRLNRRSGGVRYYYHLPSDMESIRSNQLRVMLADSSGVLWIGTENAGLERYSQQADRFIHYRVDPLHPDQIEQYSITALLEDSSRNLWIGTGGYGFHRLNCASNTFEHFQIPEQNLQSGTIRTIFEDSQGRIWLGTDAGLFIYNQAQQDYLIFTQNPLDPASLPSNRVTGIAADENGTYWLATFGGGLSRFDPDSGITETYTEADGLADNHIAALLIEENGRLWLSTNAGISRFDPQAKTFRNYDVSDGLPGNEFNPGAAYRSPRGEFFFGGVNGLVSFFPADIKDNPVPPNVVIKTFKKYNQMVIQDLTGGEKIDLTYRDDFISFEFAALDFTDPSKNQFAYQLIGFDQEWVNAGTRNYVSYTNLAGGDYTFRVKAANSDGVWNEEGITVSIHVEPPFWTKWWFIGLAVVTFAAGVYNVYRLRMRRITAQKRDLEREIVERTQEIERRRKVAESLREIIAILNSDHSLADSLEHIIKQTTRLVKADSALIFHCFDESCITILASNLPDCQRVAGWLSSAILDGQPLIIPDLEAFDKNQPLSEPHPFPSVGSLIGMPLAMSDRVDGGLILYFRKSGPVSEDDYKICQTLAEHTSLAMGNDRLRSQAEELAKTGERNRLARDLHDAVTQNLFASTLIADVLPRIYQRNPQAGQHQLLELRLLTRGALAEMRALLVELRPGALSEAPLNELMHQLCDAFSGRMRVPIQWSTNLSLPLQPDIQIAFYRIAQEALNNIAKHSRANEVSVNISEVNGSIVMTIKDNGIGFDPNAVAPSHFGLKIMRERAQSIGANTQLKSQQGVGTLLQISWQNRECRDPQ